MQPLTAPPRDHLTEAQVRALLTGPSLTIEAGLELLDTSNRVVDDLTGDLGAGGSVSWDNRGEIHGSVRLSLQRALVWGRDRVRPYVVLSDGGVAARFDLGVYVPTTPDTQRGETPVTYEVTGYDLLTLLQTSGPGDTWTAEAGSTYFAAMQAVMDAAGIGAPLRVDGDRQDTLLPATRVWALTSPTPSWLWILTDLLTEIGYLPPWMDPDGAIRSRPYQPVAERPAEWVHDTSDPRTSLVHADRTLSIETDDIANWWRGYRTDMATTPVEGDGIYTVENLDDGPSSQAALGRVIRRVLPLQAADQAGLVAQVERIRAEDTAAVSTYTLLVDPLPIMWAHDVHQLVDAGESVKLPAASWELHLDGSPGTLVLGGPPDPLPAPSESQGKGTVTSAAPLRVVVDGATVASFANALDAAAYGVGDRVTVTIRNPLPPLVVGVES